MKIPSPAPLFRVLSGLLLCAVCFQAGRWTGRLQALAELPHAVMTRDAGNEMVTATYRVDPKPAPAEEAKPLVSAGDPVGTSGDVITPLNVRDPSALVMGPGAASCPPSGAAALPPEPGPVPARPAFRPKHSSKELAESDKILRELGRKKDDPADPQKY